MKLPSLTILCLISLISSAGILPPVPAWVKHVTPELNGGTGIKGSEGIFYLLVDEQYDVAERQVYYHYAIRVTAQSGLHEASQVEISYDPSYQEAAIHFMRVHRNGNVIDHNGVDPVRVLDVEKQKSKGLLYGEKSLYVNLSDVRVGDVIEYAYSRKGDREMFRGTCSYYFNFSYDIPVHEIFSRIVLPAGSDPQLFSVHETPEPEIERGNFTSYTWRKKAAAAVMRENNLPSWFIPDAMVYISCHRNWREVKRWARRLFRPGNYDRAELKALAARIVNAHPGDLQRQADAAVDFVQNEIRYSGNEQGIYSHQPHLPDYVLGNRYGDCKDKSLLLAELLRQLGIAAWPALVHTNLKEHVIGAQPSHARFNHCIVAISFNGTISFVDAVSTMEAGPFQNRTCAVYGAAMVLDSTDTDFVKIPPDDVSGVNIREEFRIDANGDAVLTAWFTYTGERANEARRYFSQYSYSDIQKSYTDVYKSYGDDITVGDSLRYFDDPEKNTVLTIENYEVKSFWNRANGNKLAMRNLVPYYLNNRVLYPDNKTRTQPLALSFPINVKQRIAVYLSTGWSVPPSSFEEKNKFFDYRYDVQSGADSLVLDYSYRTLRAFADTADFREYVRVSDRVSENMLLTVTSNELSEQQLGFNWLLVLVMFVFAVAGLFLCRQLGKLNLPQSPAEKFHGIGGWLILLALGIIATPFSLAWQMWELWKEQSGVNYYAYYFARSSIGYDPFLATILLLTQVFNVLLLVGSIFMMFQFFRCRNSFRLYYTVYKSFNVFALLFSCLTFYFFIYVEGLDEHQKLLREEKSTLFQTLVHAAIWLPYLWYSKRAKGTFVQPPASVQVNTPGRNAETVAITGIGSNTNSPGEEKF